MHLVVQLVYLLVACLNLTLGCESQYTRRELQKKFSKSNSRSRRDHQTDSCAVRLREDPLGLRGGSPLATGCDRDLGIYSTGLSNVPPPFEWDVEYANTCEEKCLKNPDCTYYQLEYQPNTNCKSFRCTLKKGRITGMVKSDSTNRAQNLYLHLYLGQTSARPLRITGKKSNKPAGSCTTNTTLTEPATSTEVEVGTRGQGTTTEQERQGVSCLRKVFLINCQFFIESIRLEFWFSLLRSIKKHFFSSCSDNNRWG